MLPATSSRPHGKLSSLAGPAVAANFITKRHQRSVITTLVEQPAPASLPALDALPLAERAKVILATQAFHRDVIGGGTRLSQHIHLSSEGIRGLADYCADFKLLGADKLVWAEQFLGVRVSGKTFDTRVQRANCPVYWGRALRVALRRRREHVFMHAGLISAKGEQYVSDFQLQERAWQLEQQKKWMESTLLIHSAMPPDEEPKTLAAVAKSPWQRFSKLYAFTKAMDAIAEENGLSAAMLTLTLESEWHPNPKYGKNSWNGASPRDAHRSLARRWQSVLRDLHRANIGISGLRVVEAHQDGCPHWHFWMLYRPEVEPDILCTVMKYFPNKLKVRSPGTSPKSTPRSDYYDTAVDLKAGSGRKAAYPKEGAQTEWARIDRSISSGATYAMKYLLKTVDAGTTLNDEVGLFDGVTDAGDKKEAQDAHQQACKRVDAYRGVWGINAGQLFGVAKCLTAWDELRRLTTAPKHPQLHKLWVLARGTDKEGYIAGADEIQGDAKGFLTLLGGLAACRAQTKAAPVLSIGRLTDKKVNRYGESVERTRGVTLVERERKKIQVGQRIVKQTGEVLAKMALRTVKKVVAAVKTRLFEWELVPVPKPKKKEKASEGTPTSFTPLVIFGPMPKRQPASRPWVRILSGTTLPLL